MIFHIFKWMPFFTILVHTKQKQKKLCCEYLRLPLKIKPSLSAIWRTEQICIEMMNFLHLCSYVCSARARFVDWLLGVECRIHATVLSQRVKLCYRKPCGSVNPLNKQYNLILSFDNILWLFFFDSSPVSQSMSCISIIICNMCWWLNYRKFILNEIVFVVGHDRSSAASASWPQNQREYAAAAATWCSLFLSFFAPRMR